MNLAVPLDYENLLPGTIVFDNYRILRCAGKGATSVVYACCISDEYELVAALKVLNRKAAADENITARFIHEINFSNRVRHPNVIQYIELLRNAQTHAFSMELCEGGSLHDLLFSKGQLDIAETIRILSQTCLGIQAMHDAGVVHRDLKPKNILMTLRHEVKIADFSTALCPDAGKLPFDVGQVGTYEYMSPEVINTGIADKRSDIFALGVIGYQLITGSLPFKNDKFASNRHPSRRGKPAAPHRLRPDCPKSLSKLLLHALDTRPSHRFASAGEFHEELRALSFKTTTSLAGDSFLRRLFLRR